MTNTTTHTHTTSLRGRRVRRGLVVAGFALTGLAACGSDTSVTTDEPAAAVSNAVRPAMSPDALSRWAESASTVPASPDAAERWAEAERLEELEHQARVDQAACERLSQGQASC